MEEHQDTHTIMEEEHNPENIDILQLENDIFNQYILDNNNNNNNNNTSNNTPNNNNNNTHDDYFLNSFTTIQPHSIPTTQNNTTTQFINLTQNSPIPDKISSNNNTIISYNNNSSNKFMPSLMENKFKSLIDDTLTFGRTETITSTYIDPIHYINVNENDLPYKLSLRGLPQVTRVENQLKLSLIISPLVKDFYLVYLPIDSITRERFYLSNDIITYPKTLQEQLLYLDAFVIDNVTNNNINVCNKCVNREQRRASRRKSKISDNLLWCNNPNRRAIIFNNKQISLIQQIDNNHKRIELTTRIVCYCRHHKSDQGFKLLFILKDYLGNIMAKTISDPIIITDRKQQIIEVNNNNNNNNNNVTYNSDLPILSSSNTMNETTSTSNSTTPGQYFDSMDQQPLQIMSNQQQLFNQLTHQLQNNNINPQHQDNVILDHMGKKIIPSPTSMSEDGSESIPTELLYNNNYNNNNSRKRSRVNIPSTIRQYSTPALNNTIQDFTYQQPILSNSPLNQPTIERVIPSKGPINGGIEVTLLGSKFKQGLEVKFGDNIALSTQCWSETTILTYLPPAMTAGQVFVTITDPNNIEINNNLNSNNNNPLQKVIFTYIDETDRQLIELALQIVGLKMNGKLEDAKNIAKRIVDDDGKSPSNSNSNSNHETPNNNNTLNTSIENDDEQLIIKVIQSLNKATTNLSMCDDQGRTLLHLACLKGYKKLVATLVKSGVFIDSRDKFGFTPLHFASICGNYKIMRLLLACQSDSLAMTDNGLTAQKLYENNHLKDETDDYNNVIDIFDYYMNLNMSIIDRKMSQTSFGSSVFENDSMLSLNEREDIDPVNRNQINSVMYMGSSEDSDYDEYEEEFGLSDDDNSFSSIDASEDGEEPIPESFITNSSSDTDENENTQDNIETSNSNNDNTATNEEPSAWNRLLTIINEDLPKYDDLYPRNWTQSKNKESTTVTETSQENDNNNRTRRNSGILSMDSHTSSEDEDDAIQKKFNQFFQNNTLAMHKDKMLLFFWLPVGILLLTWVLWLQFSNDNNDLINKVNDWVQHYVAMGLAKIVLGNQRMKTVFRDSINNLQTSGILNDLIVS